MIRRFGRIGLLSFGGPAAQIAVMHEELVDKGRDLEEKDFLGALSFCMLLPGPEAMQLATYAGWRLRGVAGGLLAGLLFVLPGALVIAALAFAYARWGTLPVVQDAFLGIKALVIVIVLQALWKVSKKALNGAEGWALALLAFLAIFALGLPFPAIILAAGLWGLLRPHEDTGFASQTPVDWGHTIRTALIWGALWAAPLLLVWATGQTFLTHLALFFGKLAIVTFGGAYAVLAYMAQAVVDTHGWLTPDQMIDALGLAETTPGPLILVTQFTGHLAGLQQGGWWLGLTAGLLTLWMTFVPCFLWIFAFAPHVERILANPRLKGALGAITAAVVGVILNLSLWFALHVLFGTVDETGTIPRPQLDSFDPLALALTAIAAGLLVLLRLGLLTALALMAALGLIWSTLV
ncbi:chromate efflux transporter [Pseudooceanicola atlanticus]|uniref:Chromate transporter n=1 Tax=Pseudooceanicola atlanticus TaxID=1461694 RepID=A0A0A0EBV0_9RHOB|nr:chromate efflux transporter [Pseudooceanicola atlanticus]KGM47740.1 chromate transporter [Pseudooceanicola atlanticus]